MLYSCAKKISATISSDYCDMDPPRSTDRVSVFLSKKSSLRPPTAADDLPDCHRCPKWLKHNTGHCGGSRYRNNADGVCGVVLSRRRVCCCPCKTCIISNIHFRYAIEWDNAVAAAAAVAAARPRTYRDIYRRDDKTSAVRPTSNCYHIAYRWRYRLRSRRTKFNGPVLRGLYRRFDIIKEYYVGNSTYFNLVRVGVFVIENDLSCDCCSIFPRRGRFRARAVAMSPYNFRF